MFNLKSRQPPSNICPAIDFDTPELRELTAQMEEEYRAHLAGLPDTTPRRTILFYSRQGIRCNFLTAWFYRLAVKRSWRWAQEHGFTVCIVDYATPLGLLALEELISLRVKGEHFALYAARSAHSGTRKSWRMIRKPGWKLVPLLSQCDYRYTQFDPLQTLLRVYPLAGCYCTERGIEAAVHRLPEQLLLNWGIRPKGSR